MTKIKYEVTETREVTVEVPDCYFSDSSDLGQVVNVLLEDGAKRRNDLYSTEAGRICSAIRDLKEAYAKAEKIMAVLRGQIPVPKDDGGIGGAL
jgi:hypothetical protein